MQQLDYFQQTISDLLKQAKQQGATAAEAVVNASQGLSVDVRMNSLETIEHTTDQGLSLTVYFGQKKGSASTTDLSPKAIQDSLQAACHIAKYTSEDQYAGLADKELMAQNIADLDLYHPWKLSADKAIELALECESAALNADKRIVNSDGAQVSNGEGLFVYGNSQDFIGGYPTSRQSISCAVIAEQNNQMQRDYWYSSSRHFEDLLKPADIGLQAAERTLARLEGQSLSTRNAPVIFRWDIASSLLRSLIGAISGGNIYRKSSFLLDCVGQPIFPDFVQIKENPLLKKGLSSAPFDNEGVATKAGDLVTDGILQRYVLGSYSARKLNLQTTANAGGVRNLSIAPSQQGLTQQALMQQMGTGLMVTELMGHGLNMVTGDYSRGASGFWVENGEIQYPVEEITIAGNLKDLFANLVAVADDFNGQSSTRTGSWLFENMAIAGE